MYARITQTSASRLVWRLRSRSGRAMISVPELVAASSMPRLVQRQRPPLVVGEVGRDADAAARPGGRADWQVARPSASPLRAYVNVRFRIARAVTDWVRPAVTGANGPADWTVVAAGGRRRLGRLRVDDSRPLLRTPVELLRRGRLGQRLDPPPSADLDQTDRRVGRRLVGGRRVHAGQRTLPGHLDAQDGQRRFDVPWGLPARPPSRRAG